MKPCKAPSCFAIALLVISSTSALISQTVTRARQPDRVAGSVPILVPSPKNLPKTPHTDSATVYIPELKIPKDAMREYRLGSSRYAEGDFVQAEKHFSMAAALYPKFSSAFAARAMALMKLRRFDESHRAVSQALSLNRNSVDSVRVLGIILFNESKLDEAEVEFKRVLATHPHDSRSRLMLVGIAILRRDMTEVLHQTDEIDPKDADQFPIAYMARAEALEILGEKREAVNYYQRYMRIAGTAGESYQRAQDAVKRLSAADHDPVESSN